MPGKKITLKLLCLLVFSDVLETFTNLCFKKGALSGGGVMAGKFPGIFIFLGRVFSSPFVWMGLLSVVVTFIIWSTLLSRIDLSVAVPVASFSYILVLLSSAVFLGEKISLLRWAGTGFILLGVILVSLSAKDNAPERK